MESDVLRWSLLVLGSCIIIGVLVHGIWISRKNSEQKQSNSKHEQNEQGLESQGWQSDDNWNDADDDNIPNIKIDDDELDDDFAIATDDPLNTPEQFDELGIGAVRVVSSPSKAEQGADEAADKPAVPSEQVEPSATVTEEPTPVTDKPAETSAKAEIPQAPKSKIYASVVTQPKPEYTDKYQSLAAQTLAITKEEKQSVATSTARSQAQSDTPTTNSAASNVQGNQLSGSDLNPARTASVDNYDAPEPPPFLLKKEQQTAPVTNDNVKPKAAAPVKEAKPEVAPEADVKAKQSLTDQAFNLVKRKKAETERKRREPKLAEDQLRIDFDEQPEAQTNQAKPRVKATPEAKQEVQQEVLVLNVKVAEETSIPGAALLPMLLTLGFKFGEQDIFHRHVNSNGKGPVLFSLANMFKPGNFDIDNLENFTTQGVSLFMILPIEGDPHQVFNMMHNAARKIADEFSAQIYDGRRSLLTKQSLQQYVEKIREFERQRMLQR
ncbi:cell division protein ZipA [Paraglaciecola aquimarina]|uniref:Cell division protein ZipA n=1 Tax=Paraglaciecola aquimarina TaxID=1235557 RepID=A0ABU3SYY0_9ALTE|nr:cell division protein ZipA [Paraglaciecola aquimarina]MDU0355228.1 cell division protein ZipA [Paraglaciecola aquimarina]